MVYGDYSMFQTDKETELKIDMFLDEHKILKKFKGREYLRDMIIYNINYHNQYNDIIDINDMYKIMQEYKGTKTWFVIRRLSDYASNDYFKRNGNSSLAIPPKLLIIKALYRIVFKEEFNYNGRGY